MEEKAQTVAERLEQLVIVEAEARGAARERERVVALIAWEIEAHKAGDSIGELETLKYLHEAVTSGKRVPERTTPKPESEEP